MRINNPCNFPFCKRSWIDGDGLCAEHKALVYKPDNQRASHATSGEWSNRTKAGKLHLIFWEAPQAIVLLIVCGLTGERPM